MTTTEDREARLAAMRVGDPATPEPTPGFESNGSTVLESRLSQLETSVGTLSGSIEQLATIQNATTNALNTLVARAQAPDNSRTDAKIDELAKRVETLAAESVTAETAGKLTAKIDEIGIMVAELKQRPKRPSEMRLSQAQLDEMTKTVTDHVTKGVANLKPSMDAGKVGRFLVERLGESVAQRSAEHADAVADQLDDAAARLEAANGQAEQLSRSLSAAGLARVALAMVPVVVVMAMLMMLAVPVAEVLGVGPLSRWAWGSFEAADSWGTRAWIAVATLSVVGALGYGIHRAGQALAYLYSGQKR